MFLERLNKRIDDHGITYKGITIKKQLSFGVAEWDPSMESIEDMIASADSSLYLVKGKRLSIA
jgi:PleD family two-component response regulator